MKKSHYLTFTGLLMVSFLAGQAYGQSAEEILEKMIEAQGGREKLAAIKDTTVTGSFEMTVWGVSGEMTVYQKEPNLVYIDFEMTGAVITQAYDGETAWMVDPQTGSVEEMPEKAAEYFIREAYGNAALLAPEKYGISYAFKGKETIERKEYLILVQSFHDGHTVTMYIDPRTYLIYKTRSLALDENMMETESEILYSNYKKVDGVLTAFDYVIYQGGMEDMVLTTSEIKYNTGLKDSLFKMK
jgi:outer membrane lipoprotein-sorting protein